MRHKSHSLLYNRCSVHFSIRSMIGLGQLHRHQSYTSFSTAQTGPSIKRRSVLRVILCCDLQCCNPRECLGTRFRQVHRAIIKPDACYETTSLLLTLPPPHTTHYTHHNNSTWILDLPLTPPVITHMGSTRMKATSTQKASGNLREHKRTSFLLHINSTNPS
jgi:hypothetical protein